MSNFDLLVSLSTVGYVPWIGHILASGVGIDAAHDPVQLMKRFIDSGCQTRYRAYVDSLSYLTDPTVLRDRAR